MLPKDEEFLKIKSDLISEIKGMRKDINIYMKTVNIHDEALYGNKIDRPGALEDLRVLKTDHASRQKHITWVWMAVIASACERAFHYISGR